MSALSKDLTYFEDIGHSVSLLTRSNLNTENQLDLGSRPLTP